MTRRWIALVPLLLAAGCSAMGARGKPLVPTGHITRTGPFAIQTNARLEPDAPIVRQLRSLETQARETLGLSVDAGDNPVEVYVLDDRAAFDHFLTFYYPELPHRRAFFLANGNHRVVYTFFNDRLEEDVRHEAAHGLFHLAVGDMPLWLDEGLAEYFEVPLDRRGLNPEHVDRLPADLAAGWKPDLARLESLRNVKEMTPRDYRESWAWVHYLLNDSRSHKTALLAYLADLRTKHEARPLSERLEPGPGPALVAHLGRLRDQPPIAASGDPTVRLQSGPAEPIAPPRRRSLLARIRDLFGS
jgi:hypothetical protein